MQRSSTRRSQRLSDQLQREIADILATRLGDPRLSLVTVSGVRLNVNLRIAEVLYTAGGADVRPEDVAAGLEQASPRIRRLLSERLQLRFVPELRFLHDDFLEDMVYGDGPPDGRSPFA